ncbi:ABC transporter ATP-binding protein [Streptosporangium sandarakinum]|uniref:ABC-2 type transport system ATP-binding protein n=1 Tax=Streptosporangium sandarakinum TaxID=1260955 RepID=A0A852UUM5_9ACTN|nr:ABC transporter ATP-binding protein [Streptosporangium sandarakinum]NYF39660.1 ABC-2 type transport system ATP-binding protein [Streptosporangium sandarakinum]
MERAAVEFHEVSKRYGQVRALDAAGFTVARGETVSLLGHNGAGKSTAVALMLGLVRPDGGRVGVLGGSPARAVARGRVGAMLQSGGLPDGASVRDIVRLACGLYGGRRRIGEVLELAGLTELAGRRATALSGGQAQRVRFAIAVAGRPELLFLDEPTVAMDVEARREFWDAVRACRETEGTTVVFATHYLEEADQFADRVVVLGHGRVVADAAPATVKARVGGRIVRCVLAEPDPQRLLALPGVTEVTVRAGQVELRTDDADRTVGALYSAIGGVRDLEVTGAGLDEALILLSSGKAA